MPNKHTNMTTSKQLPAQAEKTAKTNELAIRLDSLAIEAQEALRCKGSFERAIAMGVAVNNLREALDEKVMTSIMKLKGSQLGFRTDERASDKYNKEIYYGIDVVRDCLIVAVSLGLSPVGNQWNILAGRCYTTKEGLTYLLRNLPGLKNLKLIFRPAEIKESSTIGTGRDGQAYQKIEREGMVKVSLSWEYNGVEDSENLEFCIRVNNGMSQDAIIGKADRKAKAWLYGRLTDTEISTGEVEEVAPIRSLNPKEDPKPATGIKLASEAGEEIEEAPAAVDGEIISEEPVSESLSKVAEIMALAEMEGIEIMELHYVAMKLRLMRSIDEELPEAAAEAMLKEWDQTVRMILARREGGKA